MKGIPLSTVWWWRKSPKTTLTDIKSNILPILKLNYYKVLRNIGLPIKSTYVAHKDTEQNIMVNSYTQATMSPSLAMDAIPSPSRLRI